MHVLLLSINWTGWTYDTLTREQRALARHLEARGHQVTFYGPGFTYDTNDVPTIIERLRARGRPVDLVFSCQTEWGLLRPMAREVLQRWQVPDALAQFPLGLERVRGLPKVLWNNDFWHLTPAQWDDAILRLGFADVLATYCPPYLSQEDFAATYSPALRRQVRFHPLPRGVDTTLFYERGLERDIDVCLLGAMGDFYPQRRLFHESLSRQTWLRYFHQPHPGYGYQTGTPAPSGGLSGEDYARVLARSKVFVSCTGRYRLPFIKISEVLASGAVLMCDEPCGARALGLRDGDNYVAVDAVNLMGRLRDLLHDAPRRERIAQAGRRLAEEHLALPHYARRTADLLLAIHQERQTPVVLETPVPEAPPALAAQARQWVRQARAALGRRLLPAEPAAQSPALEILGGTQLDWARVREHAHILDCGRAPGSADLRLIQHLGLNAYWGRQPVVTQNPEVVSFRPLLLQDLARRLGARHLAEIGTARGMQSLFWARYLDEIPDLPGRVFTCDLLGHDEPVFRTPLSGARTWTRRELWQGLPEARRVDFVHGNSTRLGEHLAATLGGEKLDLVYIDGAHDQANVRADYHALQPHLADGAVLIFDDCDPRFPGVEAAVNAIARERQAELRVLEFWPNAYLVTVLGPTPPLHQWRDVSSRDLRQAA